MAVNINNQIYAKNPSQVDPSQIPGSSTYNLGMNMPGSNGQGLPPSNSSASGNIPAWQQQINANKGQYANSPPAGGNLGMGGGSGGYAGGANVGMGGGSSYSGGSGMSNPYLGAQANAISQNVTQNLQNNILPQLNSGAMQAGGYGGSRQGIAQGLAMQGANRDIANAQAAMYGNAYTADQANQTSLQNSQIGANASKYASDNSLAGTKYGSDNSLAATKYGADSSSAASKYASDNNFTIGQGQNTNQANSIANQFTLGTNANTNTATNNSNNYNLGLGQNANVANANTNTATNNANNYLLGQGQNNNAAQANTNQANSIFNQNQQAQAANTNNMNQISNNYNLGMGQLNTNNAQFGANYGLNVLNSQNGWAKDGVTNANNMATAGVNLFNNFNNNTNAAGGGGSSVINSGNPWLGAGAGWQLGSQATT